MSVQPQQEDTGVSPIIAAKSLLSSGDVEGAFDVVREAADDGNVMACYDAGFMMIQGIGCKMNWQRGVERGLELICKGRELEEHSEGLSWKSDGSVTEVIGPQTMDLAGLF